MPPLSLSAHSARVKVLSDRRLEGRDEPAPGQQRGTGQRLGGYSVGKLGPPRGPGHTRISVRNGRSANARVCR